ncbi:methyltransferase domain-containing protein [Agromyces intestinalis]|uniref:Methyltransferase domain-containing protein n=1 Tax=Agromyces intestinalis TaxID=2592652 RepID=A0A5C1YBU0_9MICO|nr:methyltransferase domain-containing protein [Agromyces intestinalis]QEO13028.1 methyltransferase domain-containing protein [Agromyces intestinalis]
MTVDTTWFRCPNCLLPLAAVADSVYGCANGHRFDRSKHGYLTLLPPRAPKTIGDDRRMLEARANLLASGVYSPVAEAVSAAARATVTGPGTSIVDLGCGTGYYSAVVARDTGAGRVLVADRSPDAVRWSRLHHRETTGNDVTGVVLDLWRPLPIADATADIVLDVFAPRNPAEYARILSPVGTLIVVVPTPRHLAELRSTGSLLEIPDGKDTLVTEQFTAAGLRLSARRSVEYAFPASADQLADLVAMGPSAHHAAAPATLETRDVTAAVDVLAFAHPQ